MDKSPIFNLAKYGSAGVLSGLVGATTSTVVVANQTGVEARGFVFLFLGVILFPIGIVVGGVCGVTGHLLKRSVWASAIIGAVLAFLATIGLVLLINPGLVSA